MRGVNKVIIVGTLGQDPDTKYTGSGLAITTLSLATNESWTDKTSGEKQERTEWHRVKFFGKLAEIAGEYLAKGGQVYIEGKLQTDKWTDKDGVERYTTNILASELQMLGAPREGGGGGQRQQQPARQSGGGGGGGGYGGQRSGGQGSQGGGGGGGQGTARERAQRATEGTRAMDQSRGQPPLNEGFDDDDIPF